MVNTVMIYRAGQLWGNLNRSATVNLPRNSLHSELVYWWLGEESESVKEPCEVPIGRLLSGYANLWKATVSFVMPARPHGITQLPLDGFSWNLTFEGFSKTRRENSSLVKIWKEWRVHYMISAHFFLEWKTFQTKVVQKIKNTHFVFNDFFFFFSKIVPGWDKVEKHGRARQATDDNMAHAHCMLDR
jgi:hypothetical protein